MTTVYNKCYYIVATYKGKHYYMEGEFTQQEIDHWVNNFNIDEFIAFEDVQEEYCGPAEGTYAVIRQDDVSSTEAIDIGYATKVSTNSDGTSTYTWGHNVSADAEAAYRAAQARIKAEVLAEYGDVDYAYVCQKRFA